MTLCFWQGWGKGTVFINGYHLGRYWNIGPQKTLFVPAPYLKSGSNLVSYHDCVYYKVISIDLYIDNLTFLLLVHAFDQICVYL